MKSISGNRAHSREVALKPEPPALSELLRGINPFGYKESLSAQAARYLISLYSEPGETVLDPDMGCGCALAEAVFTGRNTIGIGGSPLEELTARVRLFPHNPSELKNTLSRFSEDPVIPQINALEDSDLWNFFRLCAGEAMISEPAENKHFRRRFLEICGKYIDVIEKVFTVNANRGDFSHLAHLTEIGLNSVDMAVFMLKSRDKHTGRPFDISRIWPDLDGSYSGTIGISSDFREIGRVLKPGGYLCIVEESGERMESDIRFDDLFYHRHTIRLISEGVPTLTVTVTEKRHQ